MAWNKAYFDGFQILSALCWPSSSLLRIALISYAEFRDDVTGIVMRMRG